jgi:Holliday junction resolvasome RuvABC DNA-binding subunit
MLTPEVFNARAQRLSPIKSPMALFTVNTSNGRCLIAIGPSNKEEIQSPDMVLQPNVSAQNMAAEMFLFEDTMQWLFARAMTEVDRVGWKSAASLLYKNDWEILKPLYDKKDATAISRLPSFGTKTGKAILKEVCKVEEVVPDATDEDAVGALRTMGYKAAEAKEKVRDVLKRMPDATTEQVIAESLKK